jgi:hypothetical protein
MQVVIESILRLGENILYIFLWNSAMGETG